MVSSFHELLNTPPSPTRMGALEGVVLPSKEYCRLLVKRDNDYLPSGLLKGYIKCIIGDLDSLERWLSSLAVSFCCCFLCFIFVVVQLLSCVQLFLTPWTAAQWTPLSMGLSRQEYWSGLPFPSPGDLPNPGTEPRSPVSPALQADSLAAEPQRQSWCLDGGCLSCSL